MCGQCDGIPLDEIVDSYAHMIEEHGWAACGVIADDEPAWMYTLGLQGTYGHPELVIYGLAPQQAHAILRDAVALIHQGRRLEPGSLVSEVLTDPFKVAIVKVDEPMNPLYPLNMATHFREPADIEAVQLVWPAANGRYPWEDGGQPAQAVFGSFHG